MSAEALSYVIKHSPYTGNGFAIHMLIGDVANDQHDFHFFMSNEELALKARCTRQTVNTIINKMVEEGFLEVIEKSTKFSIVRYAFVFKNTPAVYIPRRDRDDVVSKNSSSSVKKSDTTVSKNSSASVKKSDTELNSNSKEELEEELNDVELSSAEKIQRVWDAYNESLETFGKRKRMPKLTRAHSEMIRQRLTEYSVEDLQLAVTGWLQSEWNTGGNPDGRIYDNIETFLRNGKQVERYIGYHEKTDKPLEHQTIDEKWGRETKTRDATVISNEDWDD